MDRTEFLQMCQKCSALDFLSIPEELQVCCGGIKYIPYGYEMKFKQSYPIHNAILKDIKANSIIYADLGKVDKLSNL